MKVLHTSDWHLGKKLYKKSRHEEHVSFLSWLKITLLKEKIDILVIAGDVFDTARPPTESLKLYFDFLNTVADYPSLKQVLIIAGNHDSGQFLEAPYDFLAKRKIKVVGSYTPPTTTNSKELSNWQDQYTYNITQNATQYRFALMPFFKVSDLIANNYHEESNASVFFEDELTKLLHLWQENLKTGHSGPSMMIAHHLFGRYIASGSEQTVSLSGLDSISTKLFKDWDILALGHIHQHQTISKEKPLALYSGSPLSMRFSESQGKSVIIYKHTKKLGWSYERIPIPISRVVTKTTMTESEIEHFFSDFMHSYQYDLSPYLELTIKCKRLTVNLIDRLRSLAKENDITLLNIIPDTLLSQDQIDHECEQKSSLQTKDLFHLSHHELFNKYLNDYNTKQNNLQDHKNGKENPHRGLNDLEKEELIHSFHELLNHHESSTREF